MRVLEICKKQWAGALATWCKILLLHVKTIVMKSHNFELACLQEKKNEPEKDEHFGHLVTFSFGTFTMSSCTTRSIIIHNNTQR